MTINRQQLSKTVIRTQLEVQRGINRVWKQIPTITDRRSLEGQLTITAARKLDDAFYDLARIHAQLKYDELDTSLETRERS